MAEGTVLSLRDGTVSVTYEFLAGQTELNPTFDQPNLAGLILPQQGDAAEQQPALRRLRGALQREAEHCRCTARGIADILDESCKLQLHFSLSSHCFQSSGQ